MTFGKWNTAGELTFANSESLDADDLNDSIDEVVPPIGSIIGWAKTFGDADDGTTDGTTSSKLVDSGQNFSSTVAAGYVVWNTTDDTFAYVTAVDSDTTLSLSADIMVSGEDYEIFKTPALPSGWVECDGSVLSDADSIFNGETLPDLNGDVEETYSRFLRGHIASGKTEASQNKSHSHDIPAGSTSGSNYADRFIKGTDDTTANGSTAADGGTEARPMSYTVVWIMRVK